MPTLQQCAECGAPLPKDGPKGFCPACALRGVLALSGRASEAVVTEKLGDYIGRYKLLEQIGIGGMGVVWMAEQTEPVRRRVALKAIKLGMDTHSVIARFEAERQALAMMDHPNIAKVLDAGATPTGRPYFVMELVRGIKITDYCDQNHLPTKERLDLFVKVCQAIQHAHQKGIIHRDLKPSNILVTLQDGAPVPKVIDFGIAKATEGRLSDASVLTPLHQFIGTPAYMSPEQAGRGGLDVDTRSDIYSLGVLLYELLTGQPPFDADELRRSALDEILRIIREKEPPRPSARLTTLTEEEQTTVAQRRQTERVKLPNLLRGDLDWIVMKALEKDRTRRYESASAFAHDIQRHLQHEPVFAAAPSTLYRFRKFASRHKLVLATATTIAAAILVGTVTSVWQAVRATREASRAVRAESLAQQRLTESEAITKFLTGVFQSPDPARDGRTITVAETLDTATKKLETDLDSQPARRAQLQLTLASTYLVLGLPREAIPLVEKARDYYLAAAGPEHPDTLRAIINLAICYGDVGRLDEALKLREEVLPLSRKVNGPKHPYTLKAMLNLAVSYDKAGRLDEALKLREELLPLCRKANEPEHLDIKAMLHLAISYDNASRRDEALKLREEALRLCRKVLHPEHPDTLNAVACLAISYSYAGRWDEALKLREEVLTLHRKVNGSDHPDTLTVMLHLAISYDNASRRDEALKLREEALRLCRKVLHPEHPATLNAMACLAISYSYAGRWDEALKLREEVLTLHRKVNGPEHPDTLLAMNNLAASYRGTGRADEAIKMGQSSLELFRRVSGLTNANTLNAMTELAVSYQVARRTGEAIALEEESLRLKRQHIPPGDPMTVESIENLATCYEQSNRKPEAEALRRELVELKAKAGNK